MKIFRLLKFLLIAGILIFLYLHPGDIDIKWLNYHIQLSIFVGLILLTGVIYVILLAFRTSRFLFHDIGMKRSIKKENNTYKILFKAAINLFTGAADKNVSFVKKATIDDTDALSLIKALSFKEQGKTKEAEKLLDHLIDSNEYAIPALTTMIECAKEDKRKYFIKTEEAFLKFPKNQHFIKEYYNALLINEDFKGAIEFVKKQGTSLMLKSEQTIALAELYEAWADQTNNKSEKESRLTDAVKFEATPIRIEKLSELLDGKKRQNLIEKYKFNTLVLKKLYLETIKDQLTALEKWDALTSNKEEKEVIALDNLILHNHFKKAESKLIKIQKDYPGNPELLIRYHLLKQVLEINQDTAHPEPSEQTFLALVRKRWKNLLK